MAGKEDYLIVLKALSSLPFNVGKNLLASFLQGDKSNESVSRNRLFENSFFGCMAYSKGELDDLINELLFKGFVQQKGLNGKDFWKVLEVSKKGFEELKNPGSCKVFSLNNFKTEITEVDKKVFSHFNDFLKDFNDEQKKAVVSNNKSVLCIAGAGSGKTSVLTKRIEFLVKYRSVDESKILAITFTRKARNEMVKRLSKMGFSDNLMVETFNSFCEKILKKYANLIYKIPARIVNYREKILIINQALEKQNLNVNQAIHLYFSSSQINGKNSDQLFNTFLNDCFLLRDYFKFKNKSFSEINFNNLSGENKKSAEMIFSVCKFIDEFMKNFGFRDFADQLLDVVKFFKECSNFVPELDHVLIDEYQDVNSTQVELVDLLKPKNIFCVGDPRQSIYGWRGSDVNYILDFGKKYLGCEVVVLTKNYRSNSHIVKFINSCIKNMGLADLESVFEGKDSVKLLDFDSEISEFEFVVQSILENKTSRNEIFVLARTNRQLNELSKIMNLKKISHIVRSDEVNKTVIAGENDVTLATIHAIKGLEAEVVFVIGCTSFNFPCITSDHPVVEMVKMDEYDKDEEERRLFYVALSRAKNFLYLTYCSKKHSFFITNEMLELIGKDNNNSKGIVQKRIDSSFDLKKSSDIVSKLKDWRYSISKQLGVPSFMIFHDKTLFDLAQKMPLTIKDLEDVYGFGPLKIKKHGEEILKIINE